MVIQCAVACALAVIAMMITFGLVRFVADLVIFGLGLGAIGGVVYLVVSREWTGWPEIILGSLGVGVAAALLSLPVVPFSSLQRRRK